jgi:hypothetical protein
MSSSVDVMMGAEDEDVPVAQIPRAMDPNLISDEESIPEIPLRMNTSNCLILNLNHPLNIHLLQVNWIDHMAVRIALVRFTTY